MQGLIVSNKLGNSSQELRQIMEALLRFGRTNVGPLITPLKIGNQFCANLHYAITLQWMVDIEFADSAATAYSKKQVQGSPCFQSWPKR